MGLRPLSLLASKLVAEVDCVCGSGRCRELDERSRTRSGLSGLLIGVHWWLEGRGRKPAVGPDAEAGAVEDRERDHPAGSTPTNATVTRQVGDSEPEQIKPRDRESIVATEDPRLR
jgi:hypothetical protein